MEQSCVVTAGPSSLTGPDLLLRGLAFSYHQPLEDSGVCILLRKEPRAKPLTSKPEEIQGGEWAGCLVGCPCQSTPSIVSVAFSPLGRLGLRYKDSACAIVCVVLGSQSRVGG